MNTAPRPRREVRWSPTEAPLTAIGVVALGPTATALARRLLLRDDLGTLRGVAGDQLLVVLGPTESLPWCDGVVYLGQPVDAPGVLWPTTLAPDAPAALVARALTMGVDPTSLPVAALPHHGLRVPLGDALPIDPNALRAAFPGDLP